MGGAEQLLGVPVGAGLVFSGEVQVNIRRLVPLKAQERLKGNVVTVLVHMRPADGAVLFRHIKARAIRAVGNKFAVLAFGADVMGRQRIYL